MGNQKGEQSSDPNRQNVAGLVYGSRIVYRRGGGVLIFQKLKKMGTHATRMRHIIQQPVISCVLGTAVYPLSGMYVCAGWW